MNDFFSTLDLEALQIVDWGYTEELQPKSFERYEEWVQKDWHGSLKYLSDHRKDVRSSLSNVMEDCQSALVFLFSYHPSKMTLDSFYQSEESNGLKVAGYCFGFEGKDYHLEIGERLKKIGDHLIEKNPDLRWRLSLDIQPVLERDLAYRAGLGWVGKNSMMINRHHGSFLMIGSLLLSEKLPLISRLPETDHCGQCRACADSCPTDAIDVESRTLVAEKCISTFTIEHFKEVPAPIGMEKSSGEIFGCDICQDVCPWNKRPVRLGLEAVDSTEFKKAHQKIFDTFLSTDIKDVVKKVEGYSVKGFEREFKETPLGRTGKKGILKNLKFWIENQAKKP